MKVYDAVKIMLKHFPECRNSDKKLLWKYWSREIHGDNNDDGYLDVHSIMYFQFPKLTTAETITRARRAVQKSHPELQAVKKVKEARANKANNPNGWLY